MNTISLSIEDNILVLQGELKISNLEVPAKFLLRTNSDVLAFTEGMGRNSGLALQFVEKNKEGYLLFFGFQFKRVN